MADKTISELVAAEQITATDMFVLEQNNTAKKLTGQVLLNWLVKVADGHGGISSIAKQSTSGLKDTYRITLADTTTFDFVVTNGKSITSIAKQSTSGLTDTYKISYNDGTSTTFPVTNGRAIKSWTESVSGLTHTYTITYNDNTTTTAKVTDGRGIKTWNKTTSGLKQTHTITYNDGTADAFTVTDGRGVESWTEDVSGLVHTYTITYNDGSTTTVKVTDGEKGDKGDNAYTWVKYAAQQPTETDHSMFDTPDAWIGIYVGHSSAAPTDYTQYKWYKQKGDNTYTWIKYASQKPTASSHSMSDIPDNWIGIYAGNSPIAPTDYSEYDWFQFKGEKGDTGAPATLNSAKVEYQVSDSGTIIPSGEWSTSVPVVAQGKYLWTRTTQTYNTGNPVVSYSVSRMGLDGSGSVSSVANISPDSDGNIPLTAEDVGALPSTGGGMTGELKMNGQPISGLNTPTEDTQAATKGYVDTANAASATKLATARTIQTDLASTKTASFDGTGNVTPGVTGTLPIANGGTGATTTSAALTNLGAAAENHNHSASNITSGTLSSDRLPTVPITKGGTGATTAAAALTNLGAMASNKVIRVFNVALSFDENATCTYTNANIQHNVSFVAITRIGIASFAAHAFSYKTNSGGGSITIQAPTTFASANMNVAMIIVN